MVKNLIIMFIAILFCGCVFIQNRDTENVEIKYTSGKVFCRGQYETINGEISYPTGNWILYYPNGQIKEEITYFEEYSDPGLTIKYDSNGLMFSKKEIEDYNNYYYEEYFDNGKRKLDKHYQQEFYTEEGMDFLNTIAIFTEYYYSGEIKNKYTLLNGMYYGEYIEFNTYGDSLVYYNFVDDLGF